MDGVTMDTSSAVIVGAAITGAAAMVSTAIAGLVLAYKTYHETKKVAHGVTEVAKEVVLVTEAAKEVAKEVVQVNKGVTEVHQVVNSKNDALVAEIAALKQTIIDLREDRQAAARVASELAGG